MSGWCPSSVVSRLGLRVVLPLALSAIAVSIATVKLSDRAIIALAFVVCTALELEALRLIQRSRSPVPKIPIIGVNAVGLFGYLCYNNIAADAIVSARFADIYDLQAVAAPIFLVAGAAFACGSLVLYAATSPKHATSRVKTWTLHLRLPPGIIFVIAVAPLVLLLYGKGSAIYSAPAYLDHTGPAWALSVGNSLAPISLFGLAIAILAWRGGTRVLAAMTMACWAVVLFSAGTRRIALIPAVFFLALYLVPDRTGAPRRVRWPTAVICVYVSIVLIGVALRLRGSDVGVGFVPFLGVVQDDPWNFLKPDLAGSLGNILFGVPLSGYVASEAPHLSFHALATSITPLPSGLTDWGEIAPTLRVNAFTPYAGIGELANHGWLVLVVFTFGVGVVFAACDAGVRSMGQWGLAMSPVLVGLSLLFTLDFCEYNLRSSTRIVYYCAALTLAFRAIHMLTRSRQTSSDRSTKLRATRRTGARSSGSVVGQASECV